MNVQKRAFFSENEIEGWFVGPRLEQDIWT